MGIIKNGTKVMACFIFYDNILLDKMGIREEHASPSSDLSPSLGN